MVQLSIDGTKPAAFHFEMGQKLAALRDQGVMIVASGNVVHNLRKVRWGGGDEVYPWASRFEQFVRDNLEVQSDAASHPLVNFMTHPDAALANPTPEHYLPLLYVLGARQPDDAITLPVEGMEMGAISMLSVQAG